MFATQRFHVGGGEDICVGPRSVNATDCALFILYIRTVYDRLEET